MNERLNAAMRRLAHESSTEPSREIEQAVMAEFDRVNRRGKRSWWLLVAAAAAAITVGFVLQNRPHPQIAPVPEAVVETEQPFVLIPYVTPLAPYERAEVVRMEVPVAALIAAGLPVRTSDPGGSVHADVVVGQDGRPRAVRLVPISDLN